MPLHRFICNYIENYTKNFSDMFFFIKYFIAKHKFNFFFVKQKSKSAHRYNGFMLINNIVEDIKKHIHNVDNKNNFYALVLFYYPSCISLAQNLLFFIFKFIFFIEILFFLWSILRLEPKIKNINKKKTFLFYRNNSRDSVIYLF